MNAQHLLYILQKKNALEKKYCLCYEIMRIIQYMNVVPTLHCPRRTYATVSLLTSCPRHTGRYRTGTPSPANGTARALLECPGRCAMAAAVPYLWGHACRTVQCLDISCRNRTRIGEGLPNHCGVLARIFVNLIGACYLFHFHC